MAHKEACLPGADHYDGDVVQGALVVLYFVSPVVLALCVVVGLILGAIFLVRAVSKRQSHA